MEHTFNNGRTYTLHAFSGKYVQYELPDSWLEPGALGGREVRDLVDLTDMLYAQMAELIVGEPQGEGLLSISINPDDSGASGVGCGGCKGIELSGGVLHLVKQDTDSGLPTEFVYHEMLHNFDLYYAYLGYYDAWGHAWTSFLQHYMPYYTRKGDYVGGPDDKLEREMAEDVVPWDALGTAASWAGCVREGSGCEDQGVVANEAWAGMLMRFSRIHGVSAVRNAFRYLREYVDTHPSPPVTPEDKNDLLIESLAAGAGLNISCELDSWNWELSEALRAQLATTYPGTDPACSDGDGDGYSPAQRDYDDQNASIHPGAIEVPNGIDEDCDGVIDDILTSEESDFTQDACSALLIVPPARVVGGISSNLDKDTLQVDVRGSKYVKARLWSKGGLTGTLCLGEILNCGFGCGLTNIAANQVDNIYNPVALGSNGALALWPPDFPGVQKSPTAQLAGSGSYELIVDVAKPTTPNPVKLNTSLEPSGTLRVNAAINTSPIGGEALTDVRFWANGVGFIQTVAIAKNVSFSWTPPEGYCGLGGIRAQLLAGDHPISAATSLNPTLANISTRASVGTGDNVLIGGFIITESTPKRVLVRAIGPSLPVAGALTDPILELHDASGLTIATNDNWRTTQEKTIADTSIPPSEENESAIIETLPPGAYTAVVRGAGSSIGVALVEVYDLDRTVDSQLANISTRGVVQTGDNVMIGGSIILGDIPADVLIRALGPALTDFGVSGALEDPVLELHDKDGALITTNDNWKESQQSAIEATGLAPTKDQESAILATLTPDNYTAIVRGKDGSTGVALVEVYNLTP